MSALWWALNPFDAASWMLGMPFALLAAWAGAAFAAPVPRRIRMAALLRFAPYFLLTSLRGGIDVAWRALHPSLPIDPVLVRHPLWLPEGTPRTFFVNVTCLMPGTVSADIEGSTLVIHALAKAERAMKEIAETESRVAGVFGIAAADRGALP